MQIASESKIKAQRSKLIAESIYLYHKSTTLENPRMYVYVHIHPITYQNVDAIALQVASGKFNFTFIGEYE